MFFVFSIVTSIPKVFFFIDHNNGLFFLTERLQSPAKSIDASILMKIDALRDAPPRAEWTQEDLAWNRCY